MFVWIFFKSFNRTLQDFHFFHSYTKSVSERLFCMTFLLFWESHMTALDLSFFIYKGYAAAAAKSLQSCPNLCDPMDGSPPGSPIPGILQARTLEWVAISFSNAWKWKVKVKSLSHVRLSDPMDCNPPGSSIHGIFQARVLEWGAIALSNKGYMLDLISVSPKCLGRKINRFPFSFVSSLANGLGLTYLFPSYTMKNTW